METIFDLPAHPLFVHAPIVLAPVLAAGALAIAARPAWRRRHGFVVAGGAIVVFVMTLMAKFSGEELYELLKREPSIARHEELADQTTLLLFAFMLVVVAFVALGHVTDRRRPALATDVADAQVASPASWRTIMLVLALAASVLGVLSTVWMIRTGHEGAKSHWSFVNQQG